MKTIVRQGMPTEQKNDLDAVTFYVRRYLERWHKTEGQRHSKTVLTFEGDRYKPTQIDTHFRKGQHQ
jgi:hypothetical protein